MNRNRALWIVQGLLAALFLFAGGMKLITPVEVLSAMSPFPGEFIRFIGVCEVLGAVGLILPYALRILPGLTALAAAGLVVIMVGATVSTLAIGGGLLALPTLVLSDSSPPSWPTAAGPRCRTLAQRAPCSSRPTESPRSRVETSSPRARSVTRSLWSLTSRLPPASASRGARTGTGPRHIASRRLRIRCLIAAPYPTRLMETFRDSADASTTSPERR